MIFNIIFGVLCVGCGILYSYRSYKDYKAFFKRKNLGEYRFFLKVLRLIKQTGRGVERDFIGMIGVTLSFRDNKFEKCFKIYRSRVLRKESKKRVNAIIRLQNQIINQA